MCQAAHYKDVRFSNMYISMVFILIAVLILIWDFKFSRASKAIKCLKDSEPDVYSMLYFKSVLPPSSNIGGIIVRGLYQNIRSKPLKDEILAINERSQKYVLWPWALFIGYIFLNLILRAVYGS